MRTGIHLARLAAGLLVGACANSPAPTVQRAPGTGASEPAPALAATAVADSDPVVLAASFA